jgi:hypothetical protein
VNAEKCEHLFLICRAKELFGGLAVMLHAAGNIATTNTQTAHLKGV